MYQIVAMMGGKGSGKDTVANIIKDIFKDKYDNIYIMAFADSLKSAVAQIFAWDVSQLEGRTPESRIWREQEIPELSKKIGKTITPRVLLQQIGTNILRRYLYDGIWVDSVLYKIEAIEDSLFKRDGIEKHNLYIITDCRFHNEIAALKEVGAKFIHVERMNQPQDLVKYGYRYNNTKNIFVKAYCKYKLRKYHRSEWDWIGVVKYPIIVYNLDDLDSLKEQVGILTKEVL